MSAIVHSPSALRPLDALRQAMAWCQMRGITVRIGSDGIEHAGHRWWLTPGSTECSPMAALVLQHQPPVCSMPEAPAVVLETHVSFVEGFEAGLERKTPSGGWLNSMRRQLYLDGYDLGSRIRTESLTTLCLKHGCRYRRIDGCTMCEEDLEAARNRSEV